MLDRVTTIIVFICCLLGIIVASLAITGSKMASKEKKLEKIGNISVKNSNAIVELWHIEHNGVDCVVLLNIRDLQQTMLAFSQVSCE